MVTTQAPSELLPNEVAEVERHKYFLSEKAGYDVGWEHAEADWLAHHAIEFRQEDALPEEEDIPSSPAPRAGKIGNFFDRLLSKSRAK